MKTAEKIVMCIYIFCIGFALGMWVMQVAKDTHPKVPINGRDSTRIIFKQNIEVIGNIYENPELL